MDNISNTIEKINKNDCCGCSSCAQKCPKGAIIMQENEEGFLYPVIDKEKCVNCGLCSKACPQLNNVKKEQFARKIYALYNKEKEIQLKSSSGGVFTEIANYVLNMNGVVCGAAFNDKFKVRHIIIDSKKELYKLRKSKYVQSNINEVYKKIEDELKCNKIVLFSGTPCQVYGLKCFLGKGYDNLITCDIVCHGVPSQKFFDKYLEYMSNKQKSRIKSYDFRAKDIPGCEKIGKITFENNKNIYLKIGLDPYYSNFLEGNIFRESCYSCKYSNMNRIGDITIGDYIGVLENQPEAYSQNGTSICIVNSKKGESIFNEIKNRFTYFDATENDVTRYNSNLKSPKKRPICRDNIGKNCDDSEIVIENLKKNMNKKNILKSMIPIKAKNIIKKLRGENKN